LKCSLKIIRFFRKSRHWTLVNIGLLFGSK
jgi:hypothetical protein